MIWGGANRILERPGLIRLGHRGAILLILAFIDVAYGLVQVTPSGRELSTRATEWREHYAPAWIWGTAWIVVGAVLVLYAFRRKDAVGYAVAIGWKMVWAMTAFASWAFGGVTLGWFTAIIWFVFAGMAVIISDWPEPAEHATIAAIAEITGELPGGDASTKPGGEGRE